jgi:hypothetical protein
MWPEQRLRLLLPEYVLTQFWPWGLDFLCSWSPREAMNNHIFKEYLAKLPKKTQLFINGTQFLKAQCVLGLPFL